MPISPRDEPSIRPPHPLAERLIERLRAHPRSRVLDFGSGSGRNATALRRAGFAVIVVDDASLDAPQVIPGATAGFDAAIATHALLHGTVETIAARLATLAALLSPAAALHATFGSTRDGRFGRGRRIAPQTFAAEDGDEAGVAHTYFGKPELERLLQPHFTIERSEECRVDAIAGSWAHPAQPLAGAVHWFVIARRRD